MHIILATDNEDKVREFRQVLPDPPFQITPMRSAGFSGYIKEDGATYTENALIKARTVHQKTGGLVLADDSGLSIDVLDGAPGLYSARFAGVEADYIEKIACLYAALKPYPKESWHAAFICAIAIIWPDGQEKTVLESVQGMIAPKPKGEHGFGYDPIFYLPDRKKTMAELPDSEKNRISHRGKALAAVSRILLDRR